MPTVALCPSTTLLLVAVVGACTLSLRRNISWLIIAGGFSAAAAGAGELRTGLRPGNRGVLGVWIPGGPGAASSKKPRMRTGEICCLGGCLPRKLLATLRPLLRSGSGEGERASGEKMGVPLGNPPATECAGRRGDGENAGVATKRSTEEMPPLGLGLNTGVPIGMLEAPGGRGGEGEKTGVAAPWSREENPEILESSGENTAVRLGRSPK